MKRYVLIIGSILCFSAFALADSSADELFNNSYLSLSKGDCTISNAMDFAPAIESFRMLLPSPAIDGIGSFNGFINYNMLGSSASLMSAAKIEKSNILLVENTTVSSKILLGLGLTGVADLKVTITKTVGVNQLAGLVSISKSGKPFLSTFSCK